MPRLFAELVQDSRYAIRALTRQPVYALTIVLTFGIGVGMNMAVFTLLDAALLRPLPFASPERLMSVSLRMPTDPGYTDMTWSYPKYNMFAGEQRVFEAMGLYAPGAVTIQQADGAERIDAETITSGYFAALGATAARGGTFVAEDDGVDAPARHVVISDAFWRTWLGARGDVIGQSIAVNGRPLRIIGIMPPGFHGLSARAQLWVPLRATRGVGELRDAGSHNLRLVARVRPDVGTQAAAAAVATIGARIDAAYPDGRRDRWGAAAYELAELRTDRTLRFSILAVSAAVVLVLMIACVNITSLIIARASARRRELAVRVSLGASPARLTRQLLTETLILGASGLAVAAVLGTVMIRALAFGAPLSPASFAGLENDLSRLVLSSITLDWRAVAAAIAISLVSALVVGMIPAMMAAATPAMAAMRGSGASQPVFAGFRRLTTRGVLVIAEIALAVVLLVGAGLTIRSLQSIVETPLGFDVDRIVSLRIRIPAGVRDADSTAARWEQIAARIAAIPGVTAVGVGICSPIGDPCDGTSIRIDGDRFDQQIAYHAASAGYFDALALQVLRGRVFTNRDNRSAAEGIVINEAAARQLWRGRDPFQHPIVGDSGRRIPVIGIVSDARFEDIQRPPQPAMFVTLARSWRLNGVLFARTSADPSVVLNAVRREVRGLDRELAISNVTTLRQALRNVTARSRFTTRLLTGFAALALMLAALGIYGVLAIAVSQRTREMGIRLALGAERSQVVSLVVRQALMLALAGAAIGIVLAAAAGRAARALLYEVTPLDPTSYVAAGGILIVAAMAAAALPARRAGTVSPVEVMKAE